VPKRAPKYNIPLVRQLRAKRVRLGITQKELAARIGVFKCHLSEWELGMIAPQLPLLLAWLEALDFTVIDRALLPHRTLRCG